MSGIPSLEKKYVIDLKKGSYRAFDALYTMYAKRLYAFSFKLTKSGTDAREIVQDTFVKLWLSRENLLPDESFQSYLFTIARNTMLNKMRTLINAPVFVDYLDYMNEQGLSEETTTRTLDLDEFRIKLETAKKSLSATQLKVFELSKEWALSHSEIAQQLNLSEQTIKNQLSTALKILREKLADSAGLFTLFFL